MATDTEDKILGLTANIVSAMVGKNKIEMTALPGLINDVYKSLSNAGSPDVLPPNLTPAVPIKKSVFPDYIICLEDGKKLKMLKRHLKTAYDTTPDAYRTKWGLPKDYPMVAPSYASHRSALAKEIGLGHRPKVVAEPEVTIVKARKAKGSKG